MNMWIEQMSTTFPKPLRFKFLLIFFKFLFHDFSRSSMHVEMLLNIWETVELFLNGGWAINSTPPPPKKRRSNLPWPRLLWLAERHQPFHPCGKLHFPRDADKRYVFKVRNWVSTGGFLEGGGGSKVGDPPQNGLIQLGGRTGPFCVLEVDLQMTFDLSEGFKIIGWWPSSHPLSTKLTLSPPNLPTLPQPAPAGPPRDPEAGLSPDRAALRRRTVSTPD